MLSMPNMNQNNSKTKLRGLQNRISAMEYDIEQGQFNMRKLDYYKELVETKRVLSSESNTDEIALEYRYSPKPASEKIRRKYSKA